MPISPLYHTPPAHTKPTPGVFIGAAWLGWTLGVCGCPPGPAQTVGGLRLHLRLRVGLRLSHSDNLSSHIPTIAHGKAGWRARCRGVMCCAIALCVYTSPKHTYWEVLSNSGAKTTPMNFTRIHCHRPERIIRSRIYSESKRARAGWRWRRG